MSERKVNLEEIMQEHVDPHCFLKKECYERVIDAMREACKQILELAAENAEIHEELFIVDKQSIINTIKQIE